MKTFVSIVILLFTQTSMAVGHYNRADWPHWLDFDQDCQDTRQEVLIHDAEKVQLGFGKCYVKSGKWLDPYTMTVFTSPNQLHVDHVVPLKNVSDSGGYYWSAAKKRLFANDQMNLLAVSADANMEKSAKTPDRWRPHKMYWCEFSQTWIEVKVKYKLSVRVAEKKALQEMVSTCASAQAQQHYKQLLGAL